MSVEAKELGGVHTLVWEQEGIGIRIDRLIEDSRYSVTGEILVRLAGRHIHQARMNLTSTRARSDVVRQCTSRAEGIDWNSYLEEASILVLERFRAGSAVIDFLDYQPPAKGNFLFRPFLLDGEANLFFGPGGSGKSYLASYVAAHVSKGYIDDDGMDAPKSKVLYLDYETGPEEIFSRLASVQRGLGMDAMPEIIYHQSAHPLASEIDKIQRIVAEHDIEVIIVDSVGYACGGEPESAQNAINYYNALRQLSTTTLSIGHVSKERSSTTPFGSVFWVNGARSVWEVVRSQESGQNNFEVGMLHRKINNGPLMLPLGYKISFENDSVYFDTKEVKFITEAEEKLPMKERIVFLLQEHGNLEVKDISSMLEKSEGSIRKTLHRHGSSFIQIKNGKDPAVWSLKGEHPIGILAEEDIFGPANVQDD
jgi:predicted Zn-ribbon and HTH transcriptional regulator